MGVIIQVEYYWRLGLQHFEALDEDIQDTYDSTICLCCILSYAHNVRVGRYYY
jgi:hypothetical protein